VIDVYEMREVLDRLHCHIYRGMPFLGRLKMQTYVSRGGFRGISSMIRTELDDAVDQLLDEEDL
jgi:hypothetical protein